MTEAESVPQDTRSDRERVLAYINDCNEGTSCISVAIGTGIKRSAVESILKDLVEEHAINSAWSTKGGYCMYYPCPEPRKATARPEQKDRLSAYERKLDAGEIPAPDPELDRASPDRFPPEAVPSNKCRYCGEVKEKYLHQHETFCKKNPDRMSAPGGVAKKDNAEPDSIPCPIEGCKCTLRKDRKAIYGHLYGPVHGLPLVQVHAYLDKIFGSERRRTSRSGASGPSTPADEKVPDIVRDPPGSERQLTEGEISTDEPELSLVTTDAPSIKEELAEDTKVLKETPATTPLDEAPTAPPAEPAPAPTPVGTIPLSNKNVSEEERKFWAEETPRFARELREEQERKAKEGQNKEPAPIDDTVPPLSDPFNEPDKERGIIPNPEASPLVAEALQRDAIGPRTMRFPDREEYECFLKKPPLAWNDLTPEWPRGDPLLTFAAQHRVRVGREISKLKRVERKLHRRAASLETMAERVHDARKIKERELRRFEKDLVGMA